MQLIDDEKPIVELAKIQVTNRRIIYENENEIKVIPLSQFSMAKAAHISYPWLLGVGGVVFFASIMIYVNDAQSSNAMIGMVIAITMIVLYFVTRGFKLEVYSTSGEKISVTATGIAKIKLIEFINMIK